MSHIIKKVSLPILLMSLSLIIVGCDNTTNTDARKSDDANTASVENIIPEKEMIVTNVDDNLDTAELINESEIQSAESIALEALALADSVE